MKLAILSLLMALPTLLRIAAQPWEKPIEKWTERDARRVLTNSPWAKLTVPTMQAVVLMPDSTAGSPPFPLSKLTVRWESATPVLHARRISGSTPLAGDALSHYQISVSGFRIDPHKADSVLGATEASLQYCHSDPVKAVAVRVLRDPDETVLLVLQFPRAEGIREPGIFRLFPFGIRFRPNEFHFAASVGPVAIKQKFDLRDMLFLRRLAL